MIIFNYTIRVLVRLLQKARPDSCVETLYLKGLYERLTLPSGNVEHKYYVGNTVVIDSTDAKQSKTLYTHKDHLGSTVTVTDANGSVVQHINYDAWGKQNRFYTSSSLVSLLNQQSPVESKGYTGHKEISDLGIIHMNGRIYDPTLGRFLQADPNIQAPLNSQNYNRYSYVLNNPMSYTDPSGYFFKKLYKALGKIDGRYHSHKYVFSKNQGLANMVQVGLNYIPFFGHLASAHFAADRAFYATGSLRAAFTVGAVSYIMNYAGGKPSYEAFLFTAVDSVNPDVGKALRFLYYGVDTNSFTNTTINLANEVKNYYVSEELTRFANKNSMTLMELNALLTLNSFVGNKLAGSRYDSEKNEISGFTSRTDGLFGEYSGVAGVFWDVNDTILGYQGLLDASGYDYITSGNVGRSIGGCHSLGTLTCNNLVARGYAPSAQLNSLPFGNIAVSKNATITNLGQWDIINGGWLGRLFNPISNSTPCSNGGAPGAFCHGWDANYRKIPNQ
ncbi:hypothetical protein NCCP2140_20180 [Pseudoalteromonas sp. NCCP-2140]|uniref:RHS repeat domain-containing protein n=1 Tax=Pseudoalteromonas sp. NCCP-2140 TaxID=2942288 RepID=UPI0020404058|nr:RHS repeat-associated core domain-containing protein [Pseudoalteromonas sp. NCCP-2140]GKW52965.1 hypothetical protein NCCP2140_20180 [Pseudoalteromonas sp. NCCP-2140]